MASLSLSPNDPREARIVSVYSREIVGPMLRQWLGGRDRSDKIEFHKKQRQKEFRELERTTNAQLNLFRSLSASHFRCDHRLIAILAKRTVRKYVDV